VLCFHGHFLSGNLIDHGLKIDAPAVFFPVSVTGRLQAFSAADFCEQLIIARLVCGAVVTIGIFGL